MVLRIALVSVVLLAVAAPASAASRWCKQYRATDQVFPDQAAKAIADFRSSSNHAFLIRAAGFTCAAPDDRVAAEVLKAWMGETGLDEAGAIASLTARLAPGWQAEHEALCKLLPIPDGKSELAAMAYARGLLFGCEDGTADDPAWMRRSAHRLGELSPYLDGGTMERKHDEIVRLAWVSGELWHMLDPHGEERALSNYAVAQYDIKALAYDVAMKQLAAAPLKGNGVARVILGETIGHTKAAIAKLDAAVAKRTQDPTWKRLIITVPQEASAAWLAAAAARKDMLAHSQYAETCEDLLRADVQAIIEPLAKGSLDDLFGKLNEDPLAGFLLERLTECLERHGDENVARLVSELAGNVRPIRGPRSAAYVATARAVAAIRKEPPFRAGYDMKEIDRGSAYQGGGRINSLSRGTVASVKPVKTGGVQVTFSKDRYTYTERICKETNKVDRVESNGTVVYRTACHDGGKVTADHAPSPVTVPASCAHGLAKGRFVMLEDGLPAAVFTDKTQKRVVAAYCLAFD